MVRPSLMLGACVALLCAALGACENKSSTTAQPDQTPVAGDNTTSTTGQLREEAQQVGEVVSAAAKEAGQEIDQTTDRMAAEARESEADTAAEASQDNAERR
ncbi:MAG: hypothetical protein K1X35_10370 [Caulobacteraceae bacterium]|nr:hypothetical protein [Caulobacteraceae bacterium]